MPESANDSMSHPLTMPEWSRAGRSTDFEKLSAQTWDVLVIGGGITGCGVALDAASRGLKVALVEKGDFSSGTSSRSSKLIHGGLRYLREGQFATTWEASREKRLLKQLAPHLVDDLPFLLAWPKGLISRMKLNIGLWIYDWAAGFPRGLMHRRMSPQAAAQWMPGLCTERYSGGFIYFDGRADDCRLTLHVAKRAVMEGAMMLNHVAVTGFDHEDGRVCGATLQDTQSGAITQINARAVVNATGVWADQILDLAAEVDGAKSSPKPSTLVSPSMGVHLVFSHDDLPCQRAVVLPTPGSSGAVFLIRWGEFVVAGTTDSFFDGPLDSPRASTDDVDLILRRLNAALPKANLCRAKVLSCYAGLRPLIQDESESEDSSKLSREELLLGEAPGLLTITGGKLTTYRRMAAEVVDRIVDGLDMRGRESVTGNLALFAAPRNEDALISNYGTEAKRIQELAASNPSLAEPMVPGADPCLAEAVYALKYERAVRLADILSRRTRLAVFSWQATRDAAPKIAEALQPYTHWDPQSELRHFLQQSEEFQESALGN